MTEANVPINNPAGRLHEILTKALEIKQVRYNNTSATEVLAEALEIDSNDPRDFFQGLTNLYNLVKDTKLAIERLKDINHELYLRPIQNIEKALGTKDLGNVEWKTIRGIIQSDTMALLEVCADALSRKDAETVIDQEHLSELQNEVRLLLEKTMEADLTDEIKSFIFEKLQSIEQAIINYRFYGSAALQKAIEASIGAAIRHGEQIKEKQENPVVARFFDIILKADSLLRVIVNTKQLSPGVKQVVERFLGSGNSGS